MQRLKPKWRDETPYRRSDAERVPRTWSTMLGGVRLCVTRHVNFPPDTWLAVWEGHTEELESKDAEDAKREAVALVRGWATEVLAGCGVE